MASDKLATVLDRISGKITDSLSQDIAYNKQRDDQLFGMMFQNELQNQNLYKQQLMEAGLSLDVIDQSEGFNTFAENAGDSTKMNNMVSSYVGIADYNQAALDSLTQFAAGQKAGGILRSEGKATSDADTTDASTMMFNPTELKDALAYGVKTGTISPEQAVDDAFLKGLQLNETEALKLVEIQSGIQANKINIENAILTQSEQELEIAKKMHAGTSATAASIIMDRLVKAGINPGFFKDINVGDEKAVSARFDMLEELKETIYDKYPGMASDIISALQMYAAPDEMAHTRYYGFIQLGLKTKQSQDLMTLIENWAVNNPELRSELNLQTERLEGGIISLTQKSLKNLRVYLDGLGEQGKNIIINSESYAGHLYGDLQQELLDMDKLDLHFDEEVLQSMKIIINQEAEIDRSRLELFADVTDIEYDKSFTDIHPSSSAAWRLSQELIVNDLLDEIGDLPAPEDLPGGDTNNLFDLNYEDLDTTDISSYISEQDLFQNTANEFMSAYSSLQGIPGIIGTARNPKLQIGRQAHGTFGLVGEDPYIRDVFMGTTEDGAEGFGRVVPTEQEIQILKTNLLNRIKDLNTLGGPYLPRSPFGLRRNKPKDLLSNQKVIAGYIKKWDLFGEKYEALTGKSIGSLLEAEEKVFESLDLLQQ